MTEQGNSALHSTYRWHTFDRRISRHKLKVYYSQGRNQRALLWFVVGILILPLAYGQFITAARSPVGFAVVTALALVTAHGLRVGIENVWRFWRTTEMNNRPPAGRVEKIVGMENVVHGRDPAVVVDGQVAVNAPVLLHDQSTTPERVYASTRIGIWNAGQFFHLDSPGYDVSILYLDGILARASADGEGAVRSLVVTDIHELTHWALDATGNAQVPTEHSPQWNEVIGREVDYVRNDQNRTIPPESDSVTGPPEPTHSVGGDMDG